MTKKIWIIIWHTRDIQRWWILFLLCRKWSHDAILQIQLFAKSIKVRHGYALVPMKEIGEEWWEKELGDEVSVQWLIRDSQRSERLQQ